MSEYLDDHNEDWAEWDDENNSDNDMVDTTIKSELNVLKEYEDYYILKDDNIIDLITSKVEQTRDYLGLESQDEAQLILIQQNWDINLLLQQIDNIEEIKQKAGLIIKDKTLLEESHSS